MAKEYDVYVYCEDEGMYKKTTQTPDYDENWVPPGCETHTIRDFTIEVERDV